jgi:hypothetical protein
VAADATDLASALERGLVSALETDPEFAGELRAMPGDEAVLMPGEKLDLAGESLTRRFALKLPVAVASAVLAEEKTGSCRDGSVA